MSIDCKKDLLKALGMVFFIHHDDRRCTLLGDVPRWFRKLCPDVRPGDLPASPEERFPFLMNFMVDAREFWSQLYQRSADIFRGCHSISPVTRC